MAPPPAEQPDWQPTLIGDRVIVRPMRPADWGEMFAAASDPLIWALHPVHDRHEERVFRGFFDEGLQSGAAFAIVSGDDGAIIGSSRYHGYDATARQVEIGWTFLVRRHWGGATNAEVKRLMLDHAFRYVDRVIFHVGPDNLRSRRALEKLGARLTGGTHHVTVDGRTHAHVVYEIRRR